MSAGVDKKCVHVDVGVVMEHDVLFTIPSSAGFGPGGMHMFTEADADISVVHSLGETYM